MSVQIKTIRASVPEEAVCEPSTSSQSALGSTGTTGKYLPFASVSTSWKGACAGATQGPCAVPAGHHSAQSAHRYPVRELLDLVSRRLPALVAAGAA